MQRVYDILLFIADFTVNVEGVGHVCRLAWKFSYLSFKCMSLIFGHSFGLLWFYLFISVAVSMCDWQKILIILCPAVFTVLAPLIFKNMETVIMVPLAMHLGAGGVLKGRWRSHCWGMFFWLTVKITVHWSSRVLLDCLFIDIVSNDLSGSTTSPLIVVF